MRRGVAVRFLPSASGVVGCPVAAVRSTISRPLSYSKSRNLLQAPFGVNANHSSSASSSGTVRRASCCQLFATRGGICVTVLLPTSGSNAVCSGGQGVPLAFVPTSFLSCSFFLVRVVCLVGQAAFRGLSPARPYILCQFKAVASLVSLSCRCCSQRPVLCASDLHAHFGHHRDQFLNRVDALLEFGLLAVGQVEFDNLLHAILAEDDRHADVVSTDAIFTLAKGGRR